MGCSVLVSRDKLYDRNTRSLFFSDKEHLFFLHHCNSFQHPENSLQSLKETVQSQIHEHYQLLLAWTQLPVTESARRSDLHFCVFLCYQGCINTLPLPVCVFCQMYFSVLYWTDFRAFSIDFYSILLCCTLTECMFNPVIFYMCLSKVLQSQDTIVQWLSLVHFFHICVCKLFCSKLDIKLGYQFS